MAWLKRLDVVYWVPDEPKVKRMAEDGPLDIPHRIRRQCKCYPHKRRIPESGRYEVSWRVDGTPAPQGVQCACCGGPHHFWHHKAPLRCDGEHCNSNIVSLCYRCHGAVEKAVFAVCRQCDLTGLCPLVDGTDEFGFPLRQLQ